MLKSTCCRPEDEGHPGWGGPRAGAVRAGAGLVWAGLPIPQFHNGSSVDSLILCIGMSVFTV